MTDRKTRNRRARAEPTRWLTAEEEAAWRAVASLLVRLPWALECQLQRDAGMSFIEYHALAMLSETPEHTRRMSDLAEVTNASLSRLSHLVKRLEARGLVRRGPGGVDRSLCLAVEGDRRHHSGQNHIIGQREDRKVHGLSHVRCSLSRTDSTHGPRLCFPADPRFSGGRNAAALSSDAAENPLVRRETDPTDGRYTNAVLTQAGYQHLVASAPAHVTTVRRLVIDPFSKAELRQLHTAAERILRGV